MNTLPFLWKRETPQKTSSKHKARKFQHNKNTRRYGGIFVVIGRCKIKSGQNPDKIRTNCPDFWYLMRIFYKKTVKYGIIYAFLACFVAYSSIVITIHSPSLFSGDGSNTQNTFSSLVNTFFIINAARMYSDAKPFNDWI